MRKPRNGEKKCGRNFDSNFGESKSRARLHPHTPPKSAGSSGGGVATDRTNRHAALLLLPSQCPESAAARTE